MEKDFRSKRTEIESTYMFLQMIFTIFMVWFIEIGGMIIVQKGIEAGYGGITLIGFILFGIYVSDSLSKAKYM